MLMCGVAVCAWCADTWGLDPSVAILPQMLASANYTSHMVGKWHLVRQTHVHQKEGRTIEWPE
jgi:arylsulfatase A-like enzyme